MNRQLLDNTKQLREKGTTPVLSQQWGLDGECM